MSESIPGGMSGEQRMQETPAEKIRSGGMSVAIELFGNPDHAKHSVAYCVEEILGSIMAHRHQPSVSAETDMKLDEMFNAVAEVWVPCRKGDTKEELNDWLHSVCHFFEGSQHGKINGEYIQLPSILKDPRCYEAVGSLVDNVLTYSADVETYPLNERINERSVRHDRACLSRIFGPLAKQNLDMVDVGHLDTFPLKPAHTEYSSVAQQLKQHTAGHNPINVIQKFMEASSPKEFILSCIRDGERLPVSSFARAMELVDAVKEDIGEEQVAAYLQTAYPINNQVVDLAAIRHNIEASREARETVDGLFVDVDGTLIQDGVMKDSILKYMEKSSKPVIVFTGGSPEGATSRLRALGLPEKFLPVVSKSEFRGKVLGELVDDTEPELQGFLADLYSADSCFSWEDNQYPQETMMIPPAKKKG